MGNLFSDDGETVKIKDRNNCSSLEYIMLAKCEYCNKEFEYNYRKKVKRFCSTKCNKRQWDTNHKIIYFRVCNCCKKEFYGKRKDAICCSRKCTKKLWDEKNKVIYHKDCKNCNKIFDTVYHNQIFCSKKCNKRYNREPSEQANIRAIKWAKDNPEKANQRAKNWRKKNPEKTIDINLKLKYGITLEEYNVFLTKQSGVCAICGKKDKTRLCVDHDHKTGKIRGLLCRKCNSALGLFLENIDALNKAIEYLIGSIYV